MELRLEAYRPGRSRAALVTATVLFGLRTAAPQSAIDIVPVSEECRALHAAVVAELKTGRFADAEMTLPPALARASDPGCAGLILTNLASTIAVSGRLREAEVFAGQAIGLLEKSQTPRDSVLMRALQILVATRIEQRKIGRAREAYQRLREVRTEKPEDAALIHGIGATLFQIGGKRGKAEDEYLAAFRSWAAAGRGEMADAAIILISLATLYTQERRLTDASLALERATSILERAADAIPADRIKLFSVRASVDFLQHDFRKAELDAREAVDMADREPQLTASYRAFLLTAYARILRKNRRNREARSIETRAAALRRDSGTSRVIDVTEFAGAGTAR